jgi:glycosyltransferase involved in cell wall biosynthesis
MPPDFSVITAVFNGAHHIEGCLQSVGAQKGVSVEHIVIDGGSKDGTVEILDRWSEQLAHWSSGSDSGIAEAMNKGLRRASGRWILFLHSDDFLDSNEALSDVLLQLDSSAAEIVGFPILFGAKDSWRRVDPRGAGPWLRLKSGFLHQGTFIRKEVFERIGTHDTRLRIAMDYEFFLRAWLRGVPMRTARSPIPTRMRNTGVSSRLDWASISKRLGEERMIHSWHSDSRAMKAFYSMYWATYPHYRHLKAAL